MIRTLLILIGAIIVAYFFLEGKKMRRNSEKPIFLRMDPIADNHQTNIEVKVHSSYKPNNLQLEILKKDYSSIWAHLNYLYATNDIISGKEYYTEDWFKQLANHYQETQTPLIKRMDEKHELHIQNWSSDGLVCAAIDSNLVFKYFYLDETEKFTQATVAVILLYQGDHWRIDAMRVINELSINN